MIYTKPDGTIELSGSGCCCPPGERGPGMHTNSTTNWWRVGDGAWMPVRYLNLMRVYAACADTVEEFVETVEKEQL